MKACLYCITLFFSLAVLLSCKSTQQTTQTTNQGAVMGNPGTVKVTENTQPPVQQMTSPQDDMDKINQLAETKAQIYCKLKHYDNVDDIPAGEDPAEFQRRIVEMRSQLEEIETQVRELYPDPARRTLFDEAFAKYMTQYCEG
jgi:uncharacterized protein YcfL